MHLAEEGSGPLVVLCHGFPELWYSWRSQLPALAGAHYHDAGFERERDARGFIHPKLDDSEKEVGLIGRKES